MPGSEGGGQDLTLAHRSLQHVLEEVRQLREKQMTMDKRIQRISKYVVVGNTNYFFIKNRFVEGIENIRMVETASRKSD